MLKLTIKTLDDDDDDDDLLLWYGWPAKGFILISSRDHCQRPVSSQISDTWLICEQIDLIWLFLSTTFELAVSNYIAESILFFVVSIPPKNNTSPFRPCLPEKSKCFTTTDKKLKTVLLTLSKELPSVSTGMWEAKTGAGFTFLLNSP